MAVRAVVALPDRLLQKRSHEVVELDAAAVELGNDLVDTMRVSPGCVGLAAPQIGVGRRAFCIDVTGHKKTKTCHGLLVVFDPVVVARSGSVTAREGCMSVPDLTGDTPRAERLIFAGFDMSGQRLQIETDAFEARAVQHEIDHLDGLLFLDRIGSPSAIFPRRVYR